MCVVSEPDPNIEKESLVVGVLTDAERAQWQPSLEITEEVEIQQAEDGMLRASYKILATREYNVEALRQELAAWRVSG
jgi:Tfp pilus assembly protein PilO